MPRYSFSVAGLFVLVVLVVLLSVLIRPRGEVTYGTGDHSFKAAFVTKPKVTVEKHTNVGLGALTTGTLRSLVTWRDPHSSVWIATVRGTSEQLDRQLRATAKDFKGTFSSAHGVSTVRFFQQLSVSEQVTPRFSDGLIEIKGPIMFYAVGSSNSEKIAKRFIHDFRIVKF